MIRAVTFDFWETIYHDSPEVSVPRNKLRIDYARDFFLGSSRSVTVERLTVAMDLLVRQMAAMRDEHQTGLAADELGRRLGRIVGVDLEDTDARRLGDLISWTGREHPPALVDGARELLEALRGRVKLGMISDSGLTLGVDMYAVMEADGLAAFFDTCTFSDQTGTTKPMVRQFHHTLHRLGVTPAEAVHVGDLERTDIGGAHAAGMRAIRVLHPWEDARSIAEATVDRLGEVLGVLRDWGLDA